MTRTPDTPLSSDQLEKTKRYGTYYDEQRFWKKVLRIARKTGRTALRPVLLLYYLLQDKNVSFKNKAYIIGALGYFVLPIDALPDFLIGLGYTDDLTVAALLLKQLHSSITPEIEARADAKIDEVMALDDA